MEQKTATYVDNPTDIVNARDGTDRLFVGSYHGVRRLTYSNLVVSFMSDFFTFLLDTCYTSNCKSNKYT